MQNEEVKKEVAKRIAGERVVCANGKETLKIGDHVVHFRFRTGPKNGTTYSYNVNPNTLKADYEVWICGDAGHYYVFPQELMRKLYNDPGAYIDNHHPEIRVMEVDVASHTLLFGSGGRRINVTGNFRKSLEDLI